MNYKKVSLSLAILLIAILCYVLYLFTKSDDDISLPVSKDLYEINTVDTFSIKRLLPDSNNVDLITTFSYKTYLEQANYENVKFIKRDLIAIDSFSKNNPMTSQKVLSLALTDSLLPKIKIKFSNYQPDTLITFMQWVEGFKFYAQYDELYEPFYTSIYTYWVTYIANKLDEYSKSDANLKYKYKFRFVAGKCKENKFTVSPTPSEIEKVVNNVVDSKWAYLYKRLWSASLTQKIAILIVGLFTLITYIITIFFIRKKFKK
jgi:hypothetical protein